MSELVQLAIAAFAALAAGLSAYATWRAPQAAAELAESLRRSSERDNERRRLKLHVFGALMQERASWASHDAVRALNLIDVVFHDCKDVREAWAELYQAFDSSKMVPSHAQDERRKKLLAVMAVDLGLGDELRSDDLGRVYYPNALAEEEYVRQLERQAAKARLEGQPATANSAPQATSPWPPRPK
jgi:Flp pilus assembly protein CpaB